MKISLLNRYGQNKCNRWGEDDGKLNILNDIIQEGSKGFKVTKKTNYRYVQ